MTLNRIGVVLGLAVLAGVVVASLPRGAMGAQRGGDSGSATVHSIKVTWPLRDRVTKAVSFAHSFQTQRASIPGIP